MLELVVCVGLLAFVLGPMVLSSRSGIGKTEYDMKRALGVNLATRIAERFASLDYPLLKQTLEGAYDPDQDPLLNPASYPEFLQEALKDYTKEVRFRELATDRVGIVEVEVRWYPRKGQPQTKLKASKVIVNWFPPPGTDDGPIPTG